MKRYYISVILFGLLFGIQAQTIVKMDIPEQAKEPLKVVVLFDEEVPEDMPVVLGLMGYKVTGGIEPYSYEWLQNGKVVGTGDVVVVTPSKGDFLELKATDKNRCYSVSSFSLRVRAMINKEEENDTVRKSEYQIFPTLVKSESINIALPEKETPLQANVRIFDMKGSIRFQSIINGSSIVKPELPDGKYFVSVQTDECHKVEKIIVQR